MPGPIVVTGAAGFAGSHLLDRLSQQSIPVVAWQRREGPSQGADQSASQRRPSRHCPPRHAAVEWHQVDLLDRRAVTTAIAQLSPVAIYHCAGVADVGSSWQYSYRTLEVNVLGTHNLLEAVRQAGVEARIFIPGSAMVYRQSAGAITEDAPLEPASPYAMSKLAQEMLGGRCVTADGPAVLLARSFTHLGPRQDLSYAASNFAHQIARIEAGDVEAVIVVGNLDTRRDLTDVRDTVRAYQLLMDRGVPGHIYNVCSGRAYRMGDILDGLLSHAKVTVRIRVDRSRFRPHDNPLLLGDPSRIQNKMGWKPEISIEHTLRDLLDYWRRVVQDPGGDGYDAGREPWNDGN